MQIPMVTVTSKGMLLEPSSLEVPGAMWYRAPWTLWVTKDSTGLVGCSGTWNHDSTQMKFALRDKGDVS